MMGGELKQFSAEEKNELMRLRGVGATVVRRFEEIGIDRLSVLAEYEVDDVAQMVADLLGSSCWKNSPQAQKAIEASICYARDKANTQND